LGTLRTLLALSVAYGHAGMFLGFPLVPGDTAVQVFYAISGFYMALVLNEKYRPDNSTYLLFIGNRFTRLFPAYALVLIATLTLAFVSYIVYSQELPFVAAWRSAPQLNLLDSAFLIGSQGIILGLDFYDFLTLQHGSLSFIANFNSDPHPLIGLLVIPPAWTLGIEFSFYLIAPFIVRRPVHVVIVIFILSLVLRLFLQFCFGLYGDPWSYRFFPSELALFLIGAIGYRVYRSSPDAADPHLAGLYAILCVCMAAALLINRWHGMSRIASVGLLLMLLLAIPHLFRSTKSNPIDRILGELSYPIYICDFLVIWTIDSLGIVGSGIVRGLTIIAITFMLASVLYWGIDRPVDNWRHRRLEPRSGWG
jgi:peptidoglycan/LPS O-acetylase OafA/YrhL